MCKKRRKQLFYLTIALIWGVVHYFWGKAILMFLSTIVLYWLIAGFIAVALLDTIIAIIRNVDPDITIEFGRKNEDEPDGAPASSDEANEEDP